MKIKNIFFDFDGVIAESVNVKTEAFHKMYLPYGKEIAAKVVEHHKKNSGISRFEKFKLYHKKYLNIELNKKEISELAEEFSKLVKIGVIQSRLVSGVKEFLKRYSNIINFWIISATPTAEMKEIVKAKNLKEYFLGVFGSPQKKSYWVKKIINENQSNLNSFLFIGDSMSDYNAAVENKIRFALRNTDENRIIFYNKKDIIRFNDFFEFENIVQDFI